MMYANRGCGHKGGGHKIGHECGPTFEDNLAEGKVHGTDANTYDEANIVYYKLN
jgi:hypothetical protein